MNKQEYFQISRDQKLPNRCPLLGYCDRHALTMYFFSNHNSVDYDRDYVKNIQKEGALASDYESKRIKLRAEEPSVLRGLEYGDFYNMCPEVNLFHKVNSIGDFGGIACTDGSWDYEKNSNNKVNIREVGYFGSICASVFGVLVPLISVKLCRFPF